jgi:hypothetical protein
VHPNMCYQMLRVIIANICNCHATQSQQWDGLTSGVGLSQLCYMFIITLSRQSLKAVLSQKMQTMKYRSQVCDVFLDTRPFTVHNIDKWCTHEKNSVLEPIIFADDAIVILSSKHFYDFCTVPNLVLSHMSK